MKFDDFNYNIFNPYILVQQATDDKNDPLAKKKGKASIEGSSVTGGLGEQGGMTKAPALSVHNIET